MLYKGTFEFLWNIIIEFNFLEWAVGMISTFLTIYFFRASIKIGNILIVNQKIKIPIINDSSYFMATNINVEAALIKPDQTFHLKLDRNEFILIPRKCKKCNEEKNIRSFITMDFEESTIKLIGGVSSYENIINNLSENAILRIRVHANHEFTNFGKAFEFYYIFNNGNFTIKQN